MLSLYRTIRCGAGLLVIVLAIATAVPVATVSVPTPASASYGISQRMGIDACGLNTPDEADAFWVGTPYWNLGIYIGGSVATCPHSQSFVSYVLAHGWKILPIWVGPQAPCSNYSVRMSSDPATAYNQGRSEATAAYNRLLSWGLTVDGTPVIYDLEAYSGNSVCVNAVKSFIRGWVDYLHVAPAQKAGVYGSTCGSNLAALATNSPPPDFIWGAEWDNNKNTNAMACLGGKWVHSQRHKQYGGPHNETWNGVTIQVDSDCSNGPVYPGPDAPNLGQGCV